MGPDDAVAAAELLAYPVVLNAAPRQRGRAGPGAQTRPATRLSTACAMRPRCAGRAVTLAAPAGLLVQRQVGRARALLIRVVEDAHVRPRHHLRRGDDGGRAAARVAVDLPPLNLPLAHALIARSPGRRMRSAPLRDLPAANAEAVAETLVRVSQLVVDFPAIAELDVNPLFADARGRDGGRCLAAPAPAGRGAGHRPAIWRFPPYPAELTGHVSRRRRGAHHPPDPPRGCRSARRVLSPPGPGGRPLSLLQRHARAFARSRWPA